MLSGSRISFKRLEAGSTVAHGPNYESVIHWLLDDGVGSYNPTFVAGQNTDDSRHRTVGPEPKDRAVSWTKPRPNIGLLGICARPGTVEM